MAYVVKYEEDPYDWVKTILKIIGLFFLIVCLAGATWFLASYSACHLP